VTLTWQYECLLEKTIVGSSSYNYWKGNYTAISEEFNETGWNLLLSNDDIEINWELLKEKVIFVANKYSPRVALLKGPHLINLHGGLHSCSSLAKVIKQK